MPESFGTGWEELATHVGAVAMHAALLESNIESLVSSVGDVRQDEAAGIGFSGASAVLRATLAETHTSEHQRRFAERVLQLLDGVDRALERRNLVVHGVWSVKQPGEWFVWKPKRRDKTTADWIDGETFHQDDFDHLVESLRQLHYEATQTLNDAASHERRPSAAGRKALRSKSQIALSRTR